jgi:pimeloyl-ACP methyl ester carboxylesterase
MDAYYRADIEELPDGRVRPRSRSGHIQQCIAGAGAVRWLDIAAQVQQPTLYVRTTDPYGPPGYPALMSPEQAARAMERFPSATLVEVPGNHMTGFFSDSAGQVAQAIREFLEK